MSVTPKDNVLSNLNVELWSYDHDEYRNSSWKPCMFHFSYKWTSLVADVRVSCIRAIM